MKSFFSCSAALLFIFVSIMNAKEFKQIQQWKHGDQELYGGIYFAAIDKDNQLVIDCGQKLGCRVITPTQIKSFGPAGQGPNELYMTMAMCPFNDDLAFIQMGHSIKIFTKKNGNYEWKETRWLKRDYYPQVVKDALFLDNKWFLAGFNYLDIKGEKNHVNLLTIYNSDGKTKVNLLEEWHDKKKAYANMEVYIAYHKNSALVMTENKLKAYEISIDQLKVLKEWQLEIPSFYKKMPDDFYNMGKMGEDPQIFTRNYYKWKIGYSRITNVIVEDGYLVLQLRTCSDTLKKFALLFYNIETMKLEHTIFTDDYLMTSRDGKYYFYAGGSPSEDEGTDNCTINIYAFTK